MACPGFYLYSRNTVCASLTALLWPRSRRCNCTLRLQLLTSDTRGFLHSPQLFFLSPSQHVFVAPPFLSTLIVSHGRCSAAKPPIMFAEGQHLRTLLHSRQTPAPLMPSRRYSLYKSTISPTTLPHNITTRCCDAQTFSLTSAHKTLTRTTLNSGAAHVINLCCANNCG